MVSFLNISFESRENSGGAVEGAGGQGKFVRPISERAAVHERSPLLLLAYFELRLSSDNCH